MSSVNIKAAEIIFKLFHKLCLFFVFQVLLFPEGTDLTARTRARSDEFAKKNGLPSYEYCLHPRTTGFTYLASLMRQSELGLANIVFITAVTYRMSGAYQINCITFILA